MIESARSSNEAALKRFITSSKAGLLGKGYSLSAWPPQGPNRDFPMKGRGVFYSDFYSTGPITIAWSVAFAMNEESLAGFK